MLPRLIAGLAIAAALAMTTMAPSPVPDQATSTDPAAKDLPAGPGDTVIVHYFARTGDGEVFERTTSEAPRGIQIGEAQVLPALERALLGARAGESHQIRIPSDDAFGPYRDEPGMKVRLLRAALSHRLDPHIGMRLNAAIFADEHATEPVMVPVTIIEVTDDHVVVDANHPLAGKDLVFDVTIMEVVRRGS